MAKLSLFYSKEDTLDIYIIRKSYMLHIRIYFDGNISDTGIGLDVQINGKVCAHTFSGFGSLSSTHILMQQCRRV